MFQLRERRPRFGGLIQIDGSPHDWFEERGPRCTLIVFIDDATGRLTALRFAPAETTRAYLGALRDHVLAHGCPAAFYSDRHGIFRVNAKDAARGDGKTEFGRVSGPLRIELINALTPQAKGRVERANQTLQDRLVRAPDRRAMVERPGEDMSVRRQCALLSVARSGVYLWDHWLRCEMSCSVATDGARNDEVTSEV